MIPILFNPIRSLPAASPLSSDSTPQHRGHHHQIRHHSQTDELSLCGGSHQTFQSSLVTDGTADRLDYFINATTNHNALGIENPTSGHDALHDIINQQRLFGYFNYTIDDISRVSFFLNAAGADFEIPNTGGLPAMFPLAGHDFTKANSRTIDETQNEQNYYTVLAYQKSFERFNFQVSAFSSYDQIHFIPDIPNDLMFPRVNIVWKIDEDNTADFVYSRYFVTGKVYGAELSSTHTQNCLSLYGNFSWVETQSHDIDSQQFLIDSDEHAYIKNHDVKLDHQTEFAGSAGVSYLWNRNQDMAYVDFLYENGLRAGFANTGKLPQYYPVNIGYQHIFKLDTTQSLTLRFDIVNVFDESYVIRDGNNAAHGGPIALRSVSNALSNGVPAPGGPGGLGTATSIPAVTHLTYGAGEGNQPPPDYPLEAALAGQEGPVTFRFSIDPSGRVTSITTIKPSHWPLLNRAATEAVATLGTSTPAPRANTKSLSNFN